MDGHTQLDESNDANERARIMRDIARATTDEEKRAIQASCPHRWFISAGKQVCWVCGYVKTAEELAADDIPF